MKLRKLELSNFGPYQGKHAIDFDTDEERNICIIWGSNGAGKTHILQAIKWALYGYVVGPRAVQRNPSERDAWRFIHGSDTIKANVGGKLPDAHMHVYLWLEDSNAKY